MMRALVANNLAYLILAAENAVVLQAALVCRIPQEELEDWYSALGVFRLAAKQLKRNRKAD